MGQNSANARLVGLHDLRLDLGGKGTSRGHLYILGLLGASGSIRRRSVTQSLLQ